MDVVHCQRVIFYNNPFRIRLVDELTSLDCCDLILKTTLNVGREQLTSVIC